jgi:hypothetical protein
LTYQKYCAEQATNENVTVRVLDDISEATPADTPAQGGTRPTRASSSELTLFAREVFSQVYQKTQSLTNPWSIALFYSASTVAALAPSEIAALYRWAKASALLYRNTRNFLEIYSPGYAAPYTISGYLYFIYSYWDQFTESVEDAIDAAKDSMDNARQDNRNSGRNH